VHARPVGHPHSNKAAGVLQQQQHGGGSSSGNRLLQIRALASCFGQQLAQRHQNSNSGYRNRTELTPTPTFFSSHYWSINWQTQLLSCSGNSDQLRRTAALSRAPTRCDVNYITSQIDYSWGLTCFSSCRTGKCSRWLGVRVAYLPLRRAEAFSQGGSTTNRSACPRCCTAEQQQQQQMQEEVVICIVCCLLSVWLISVCAVSSACKHNCY
jgi:hypothetical protein